VNILEKHPAPWRVAKCGEIIKRPAFEKHEAEDVCIVDARNCEVIGSTEWMRGEEALPFIVDCVNARAAGQGQPAPAPGSGHQRTET
jgi:hypothetical protein